MVEESRVDTSQRVSEDIDGSLVTEKSRVVRSSDDGDTALTVQRVVYFIASVINGLLLVRFLLSLFGANRNNGFADFIYDLTGPLVAPFRSLFSIDRTIGTTNSVFEIETLVAMIVYGLIAWLIVRLISLPSGRVAE